MLEISFGNYLPEEFHGDGSAELPRVRVAVIGTGQWAREHARAFDSNPYAELAGIRGRNPHRVEQRAAEFRTRPYTSIAAMLEKEKIDLVSICVENAGHYETTLEVLQAGCAAFVEKPFVFELDQARTLLDAAAERDLFFAIDFNHRYSEPSLRTRQLRDEGKLGDIVFASWRFSGNHDFKFEHPHIQLLESDCHGIDLLMHHVGEIESVSAEMTDKTGKDGYGTVALVFRFANGAVGTLLGSYDSSYAYPGANTLEINGTKGRVWAEDTVKRFVFSPIDDPMAQVWQSTYFDDEARNFTGTLDRHVADMIRCFRQGLPPPVPADQGYQVLRVSYAAIRSHEEGRRVAISEIS